MPEAKVEYEWVVCDGCHKEYQRKAFPSAHICAICDLALSQTHDICPEFMELSKGFSRCRLAFRHNGRCQPFD